MGKYKIEDLSSGKVAVINDGTLEDLIEVLSKAFPQAGMASGNFKFYFKNSITDNDWGCNEYNELNLPTQSVKDFLSEEPEFKWGEEVEVSDDGTRWFKRIFLCFNPIECEFRYISVDRYGSGILAWKFCRKITTAVELTKKEIAEKFGIPVDKLVIKD